MSKERKADVRQETAGAQPSTIMRDPYFEWAVLEGVPVIEEFGVDLLALQTACWGRFGVDGAIVHLKGRGDFVSVFLLDLPPGAKTAPQRHLFEEVVYVLSGHGNTTVEAAGGGTHSFEWGPRSLFALPLNARYQHFNASGRERARLAATTNLPIMLGLFHDEAFVFDNSCRFAAREGPAGYFAGQGDLTANRSGLHLWQTNLVPDLGAFELRALESRGAGSTNMVFVLADGTMHAHSSEMPVGTYKKAHRHGPDFHIFTVKGQGHSLLWYEGDQDFVRVDWRHGVVFAPPDMMYHQHFNTGAQPARYLGVALGSLRYPFTTEKRRLFEGLDVSVRDGGRQIEYEDQDPRIHEIFLAELARNGVESRMGDYVEESR